MKQRIMELWRLGWWALPIMAVLGSPWVPGVSALWGECLSVAKVAMQVIAPIITVLVIGISAKYASKPNGTH